MICNTNFCSPIFKISINQLKRNRITLRYKCLLQKGSDNIKSNSVVHSPYADIVVPQIKVNEYVWQNIGKWSSNTAVVCGVTGKFYTFSEVYTLSKRFAISLRKQGFKDGDVLAIMLPNIPEYPIVVLGALEAGLVVSTVNPIYAHSELKHQLNDSEAVCIVTSSDAIKRVTEVVNEINHVRAERSSTVFMIIVGSEQQSAENVINYEEMVCSEVNVSDIKSSRNVNDIAFLPYSSGTTGLPKGVMLTHSNVVSNFEQLSHPNTSFIRMASENNQDVLPGILPFFHIYGLSVILLRGLSKGCKIITLPRFEPTTFLAALKDYKSTVLYLVPPIILFLGNHKSVTSEHFASVRHVINGAGPVSALDGEKVVARASNKDFVFSQAYGLTEASPGVFVTPPHVQDYSSVGLCIPSTLVKVCHLDNGTLCGSGQKGEICVKGPQIMKGYHNNPEATAEAIDNEGYFHTGDVGYYNEKGRFFIVERLKELIKVKGLQVPPAELEAILRTYPGVLEAAVIGITHHSDEKPLAFVVMEQGKSTTEMSLRRYVAARVAPFKRLRGVVFVDSLPKTPSGKILRRVLKENYLQSK